MQKFRAFFEIFAPPPAGHFFLGGGGKMSLGGGQKLKNPLEFLDIKGFKKNSPVTFLVAEGIKIIAQQC